MECVPCGKIFSGKAPYEQHIVSEKHKKKEMNYNALQSNQTTPSSISSERNVVNSISCDACHMTFDSLENFHKHALSREHAEKIMAKNQNCGLSHNAVSSSGLNMNDSNELDNKIVSDPIILKFENSKNPLFSAFSKCDLCEKHFSGPEPYRQHIESAGHQKKAALKNGILQSTFLCAQCMKSFTGQIPYNQHLSSDTHKKRIEHLQFLEKQTHVVDSSVEMPNLKVTETTLKTDNSNFFCDICKVSCSGNIPYQQHLAGSTHLKNKMRQNISLSGNSSKQQSISGESIMIKNGSQNSKGLQSNSGTMKTDQIIPGLNDDLQVISTEELCETITFFLPDEKIDFDK